MRRHLGARTGLALAVLAGPTAAGGAPHAEAAPIVVPGWPALAAEFSGSTLGWAAARTSRLRGFAYWSVEASRVRLGRGGPSGPVETPVVVRTQAGPFSGVAIAPADSPSEPGAFVLLARGRAFPPPVVWCCDARGLEVVIESDGRAGAPRAVAAGADGRRVRLVLVAATSARLVSEDPQRLGDDPAGRAGALPRAEAPFPGRPADGLAAIRGGLAAWVERGEPAAVRVARIGDGGATGLTILHQPGPVAALRVDPPRAVVVALRAGRGAQVARHDLARGRRAVLWRGRSLPRIAAAGGAVAIADGRRVLAGRAGRVAPVGRAGGAVGALATDGRRVAIFERIASRRGSRVTVVRLVRLR